MKKIVKEIPARTSVTFQCEICKTKYRSEKKAEECEERVLEEKLFKVGDKVIIIPARVCDKVGSKSSFGKSFWPKATVVKILGPTLPDYEYEVKWLGSRGLNSHVYQYEVEYSCLCGRKRGDLVYTPEICQFQGKIPKSLKEAREMFKKNKKSLGEIFDDAMKKEGFKSIPVGPSPLRKSKKQGMKKKESQKNQKEALKRWEKHLEKLIEKIRKRAEKAEKFRKRSNDLFKTFKIYCYDENGKLEEDIVIHAIQRIENIRDARNFFRGYAKDIRENPKKYPKQAAKNPREYARADIMMALGLHFTSRKTHKLWNEAVCGQKARFSYVTGEKSFLY